MVAPETMQWRVLTGANPYWAQNTEESAINNNLLSAVRGGAAETSINSLLKNWEPHKTKFLNQKLDKDRDWKIDLENFSVTCYGPVENLMRFRVVVKEQDVGIAANSRNILRLVNSSLAGRVGAGVEDEAKNPNIGQRLSIMFTKVKENEYGPIGFFDTERHLPLAEYMTGSDLSGWRKYYVLSGTPNAAPPLGYSEDV